MPIIHQQFCSSPTVMPPHEQHTLGRGPGSVRIPTLPQGVALLPASINKCLTRRLLVTTGTTATAEESGLGMMISLPDEVGQRTQPGSIAGE